MFRIIAPPTSLGEVSLAYHRWRSNLGTKLTQKKDKPFVFVSYPRKEKELVDRIVSELEESGIRTWRDVDDIEPGENWENSIENAVRQASVFLYVSGNGVEKSNWMMRELELVVRTRKDELHIIPVVTSPEGFDALPEIAKQFQGVNLSTDFQDGIKSLVDRLASLIETGPSAPSPSKKNKGYAFISYAIQDHGFLADLKDFLAKERYGFWDFHENKRDYELQFHLELEGIIRDSEVMLCIVSPSWKNSKWTPREFLFAEEIKKPIFLLRAQHLEPTLLISGSSYIDFVSDSEAGYRELHRELAARGL